VEDERTLSVGDAKRWTEITAPLAMPLHGARAEVTGSLGLTPEDFGYRRGIKFHRDHALNGLSDRRF